MRSRRKIERFQKQAIETAKTANGNKKVGAVATYKGKTVVSATNLPDKTHTVQARYAEQAGERDRIYLHAEIHALCKTQEPIDTIYVARVNRRGEMRMAKPCKICTLAIDTSSVKTVWYTTNSGWKKMEVN